jgi:hypothetical protein
MSNIQDVDKVAGGGGGPIWGGASVGEGDEITGVIIDVIASQQTDMETKMPKFYPDGNPMMQLVFTLQTSLRDPNVEDDDGTRRIFAKRGKDEAKGYPMLNAITKALDKHKVKVSQSLGGTLRIKCFGNGTPTVKGYQGTKLFKATFEPGLPPSDPDLDDM